MTKELKEKRHNIIVDTQAFEKFTAIREILRYYSNTKITSSLMIEVFSMMFADMYEKDGAAKIIEYLKRALEKRGKNLKKKKKLTLRKSPKIERVTHNEFLHYSQFFLYIIYW